MYNAYISYVTLRELFFHPQEPLSQQEDDDLSRMIDIAEKEVNDARHEIWHKGYDGDFALREVVKTTYAPSTSAYGRRVFKLKPIG